MQKARTHIIATVVFLRPTKLDLRRDTEEYKRPEEGSTKEREAGRSKPRKLLLWRRVSAGSSNLERNEEMSGDFLPKQCVERDLGLHL